MREQRIHLRVSQDEYDLIRQKMAQNGCVNMSAYLRKMAIDGLIVKHDMPEMKEILRLLWYIGDYYLPNISYPTTKPTYGKYGMMMEDYLKQYNPGLWNRLMLRGKLTEHLNEIDKTARERIERMMPELMKDAGITEYYASSAIYSETVIFRAVGYRT